MTVTPPVLTPALGPPSRRRWWTPLAVVLAAGVAVGTAAALGAALQAPPPVVVKARPTVVVGAATPAPVVVVQQPAPPPAPEPEPEPKRIDPRATSPMILPSCVAPDDRVPHPECTWDAGFPAISADGKTVVTYFVPDDGGRGFPGLSIHFIDVATSKFVADLLVLDPDEIDVDEPYGEVSPALRAKMEKRAAAAQRRIDAGDSRTMAHLGSRGWHDDTESSADRSRVYADIIGGLVRIVDPATQRVLFQRDLSVPDPRSAAVRAGASDLECAGFSLNQMDVWWDPATRTVLAAEAYTSGGCMCPVDEYEVVSRG